MPEDLTLRSFSSATALEDPTKSARRLVREFLKKFWERLRDKAASIDKRTAAEVGLVIAAYLGWVAFTLGVVIQVYLVS